MNSSFAVIAERFRRAGQPEKAVALCREGLSAYPEHLSARVTLGWALLDLGEDRAAFAELKSVVSRAPDNLAAIRGLAELHERGITAESESYATDLPPFDAEFDFSEGAAQTHDLAADVVTGPETSASAHELTAPALELTAPALELTAPTLELTEPALDLAVPGPDLAAPAPESTASAAEPLFFIPSPVECSPAALTFDRRVMEFAAPPVVAAPAVAGLQPPGVIGVPLAFSPTPGEPVRPRADRAAEPLTVFASESIDPEFEVSDGLFAIEDVMEIAGDADGLVLELPDLDETMGDPDMDTPADLSNWLDRVRARRTTLLEYAAG